MIGGCAHYVGVSTKSFVLLIETFATECTVHMETVMSLTQTRTLSLHCRIRSDSANHTVFVCFGVGHSPQNRSIPTGCIVLATSQRCEEPVGRPSRCTILKRVFLNGQIRFSNLWTWPRQHRHSRTVAAEYIQPCDGRPVQPARRLYKNRKNVISLHIVVE